MILEQGQQPTRTRPKVRPSDRLNVLARAIAIKGMMVNCATAPIRISNGR